MIRSFRDKQTEAIWLGNAVRRLPIEVQEVARICFVWTGKDAESVEIVDNH